MAKQRLPEDFREFLKLFGSHEARYLLIGGHAVGAHGYPRNTLDLDVWISVEWAKYGNTFYDPSYGLTYGTPNVFAGSVAAYVREVGSQWYITESPGNGDKFKDVPDLGNLMKESSHVSQYLLVHTSIGSRCIGIRFRVGNDDIERAQK